MDPDGREKRSAAVGEDDGLSGSGSDGNGNSERGNPLSLEQPKPLHVFSSAGLAGWVLRRWKICGGTGKRELFSASGAGTVREGEKGFPAETPAENHSRKSDAESGSEYEYLWEGWRDDPRADEETGLDLWTDPF